MTRRRTPSRPPLTNRPQGRIINISKKPPRVGAHNEKENTTS
nr:MAG TPA: hypothetical protein [Caudoviricetes sp.]